MIGTFAFAVGLVLTPPNLVAQLELRLHDACGSLPHVSYAKDASETLTVSYQAHLVRHQNRQMTGVLAEGSHTDLEPKAKGFVISAYAFDHKATEPAPAFQRVLRAGERLDYAYYQVAGQDKAIYFKIAWGPKTDAKLLERLRATVLVGAHRLPQ